MAVALIAQTVAAAFFASYNKSNEQGMGVKRDREPKIHWILRRIFIPCLSGLHPPPLGLEWAQTGYRGARLGELGFLASMSGKGNYYDNAVVETFFKTIKSELIWRTVFRSRSQAETAIAGYIDGFYNPVRRHSTRDFTSPVKFEAEAMQTV